jgi:hypothetical protein
VKNLALLPDGLPLRLNPVEGIRFAALAAHRIMNQESRKRGKGNGFTAGNTQRA